MLIFREPLVSIIQRTFSFNGKNTIIIIMLLLLLVLVLQLLFTQANVIFPAFVCLGFQIWHKCATNIDSITHTHIHPCKYSKGMAIAVRHSSECAELIELCTAYVYGNVAFLLMLYHQFSNWNDWFPFINTHADVHVVCTMAICVTRTKFTFFFHPSQSRLFFILLFSFQLIKFGFEISTPFKFNHTLNYWHFLFLLLLEVKHLYAIHIFSGYYFAHRPTILLKWNHLYFCGGSILIREVHWRLFF